MTNLTRTTITETATELETLATILRQANDPEMIHEVVDRLEAARNTLTQ